jgi:hypothetical protein
MLEVKSVLAVPCYAELHVGMACIAETTSC